MKIKTEVDLDNPDGIPLALYQAHEVGSVIQSRGTMPCSICRAVYDSGQETIIRDHFHGSDFGACKRKTYLIMTTGIRGSVSNHTFLFDGHLHEHSMLSNLIAGLPEGWSIRASKNEDQYEWNGLGFKIVGHTDAVLSTQDGMYLLECKAVKDYNFKKIKDGTIPDDWVGQMQAYMIMLDLQVGYLLVKHRETSKFLEPIRIEKDIEYISKRINALYDVHQRISKGLGQPEREAKTSKDSACMFCPFGNNIGDKTCWSGE